MNIDFTHKKTLKNSLKTRYEETNELGGTCKAGEKCIGGLARMATMIKQLKEELQETNPILLNAGDNFQGTLWYSIGRWNVTAQFMNMLDFDAVVSGCIAPFRYFFFLYND